MLMVDGIFTLLLYLEKAGSIQESPREGMPSLKLNASVGHTELFVTF